MVAPLLIAALWLAALVLRALERRAFRQLLRGMQRQVHAPYNDTLHDRWERMVIWALCLSGMAAVLTIGYLQLQQP